MKHLKIQYDPGTGPVVLFDGTVDELTWTDACGQVSVTGKVKGQSGKGVADLLGALTSGQKSRTANEVVRRRHELDAEKAASDD